jgi:poly-gamma-glutamate capsule biosynthesis protein CapA/YwtB (metallophosphatase superfamily)
VPHNRAKRRIVAAAVTAALALTACTTGKAARPPSTHPAATRTATQHATPVPTKAAPRTVTVIGSGDVLIHPPLWEQAHADAGGHGYDFGPMYASIAPDTQAADLAICEMETPLASPQGPFRGWPDFNAPPQVLTALKHVGYDSCTTASNHSIDQGYAGVVRTLDELDAAGLKHTGSARTAREAATSLIITEPNRVKIAQLAYSFGFNGIPMPSGKPWLANLTDVSTILAAAHRAKQAGADIVVLSLHWGTEYDHFATQTQRDQARALLASPDIDVILGDHAHVVQPAEEINGKWVFYCMGNQISRHADPIAESREGIMPRVTFTEVSSGKFRITKAEAIPTWMQDEPKLRLIDLPRALTEDTTSPAGRTGYQHTVAQIRGYLDAYGAIKDGLVVVS